jgi:UDP-glucuronate 4-epimerase
LKILVTGGAGFIGSHLVRFLLERGDSVTVLDSFDESYDPAIKSQNLEGLQVDLVHGDVRDRVAVEQALRGVDAVVHLAALAGVRESLERPAEYASVNIGGTVTLLEALQARDNIPLVFAGSSSVYGERSAGPFKETDPIGFPSSPYAGTKRAAELMCHAAHMSWGQMCTVLRFFTVYGPRQRPTMAISKFIRNALADEVIPIFGQGQTRRDYTFVDDAVAAILAALDKPSGFSVYNVGGGTPVALMDLVQAIGEATQTELRIEHLPQQPGDVSLTWADPSEIQQSLGWSISVDLVDGLQRTVESLRN